jgi:type II secretory pathway predicted ATPase ExeA
MYKTFFKLTSNPFGSSPDPRFMYMMPQTREALAGLKYGISARRGFLVLTGEVGTGKTTLLRRALGEFDPSRVFTSFIFNPLLEPLDFLEFVMSDFGMTPANRTKSGMLIQLNRWLVERFRRGETCVVFIDEAQNCSPELLEEIRLLTNLETSSEKLLQIVLSGQPELEDKLRQPQVRQLRQRVSIWCRTQPITLEQAPAYIEQRLLVAGSSEKIFEPDAVGAIYRASKGIPRLINLICEHALILAYVEQVRHITTEIIAPVCRDLDLDTQSFMGGSGHGSGHGPGESSGHAYRSEEALPVPPASPLGIGAAWGSEEKDT